MSTTTKLFTPNEPDLTRPLSKRELQILYQVGYGKYMSADLIAARLRYSYLQKPVVKTRQINGKEVTSQQTGQAIARAASKLFHQGGYLHRNPTQVVLRGLETGSHKMIYELPPKGRRALNQVKQGATSAFAKPRSTHVPQMLHTLMINHLRVALTVECEQNPHLQLLRCTMLPKNLRWKVTYYPPNKREAVSKDHVPDMLIGFQYGKWRMHFFNEATRSNKEPQRFLDKIRRYEAYDATKGHQQQHEMKSFGVLTTTQDRETRDKLRNLVTTSPIKHRLYFASITDIDAWEHQSVLAPIWVTGSSSEPKSLLHQT